MNCNLLTQISDLKQRIENADISKACPGGLESVKMYDMKNVTCPLIKGSSAMKLMLPLIAVTMILAGCATTPYQLPPRPVEHWVDRELATSEGRVDVSDAQYAVVSSKSAKISGRVFCQQKIETYSEEINSGRKRNHGSEWRGSSASQIKLKNIVGSFTTSLASDGRFEYLLLIPEHDNLYFRDPGNLLPNMMLSRDLLTLDVSPISSSIHYPSVNLTRIPIFIAEKRVTQQPSFDLDKAVRNVEGRICSKVVLKFENMRSRLPENPLVTVIGISGPTKDDLIKTCMNLGYTKTQAISIVAELNYLTPGNKVSDSGQMMIFKGVKKGRYGIEARSAGTYFTRLDLVIEDKPITEKTVLLSPDRGRMFFKDSAIKGGKLTR